MNELAVKCYCMSFVLFHLLQLVKAFSVMKLDQHLYFEGVELCDESATLEQLRIPPNSILYLQVGALNF